MNKFKTLTVLSFLVLAAASYFTTYANPLNIVDEQTHFIGNDANEGGDFLPDATFSESLQYRFLHKSKINDNQDKDAQRGEVGSKTELIAGNGTASMALPPESSPPTFSTLKRLFLSKPKIGEGQDKNNSDSPFTDKPPSLKEINTLAIS